jgi:hypothetical protein
MAKKENKRAKQIYIKRKVHQKEPGGQYEDEEKLVYNYGKST